jgi:hypothetical protein
MTHGTLAGMIIADLVAGRRNEWSDLYDPSRKPIRAAGEFARENARDIRQGVLPIVLVLMFVALVTLVVGLVVAVVGGASALRVVPGTTLEIVSGVRRGSSATRRPSGVSRTPWASPTAPCSSPPIAATRSWPS